MNSRFQPLPDGKLYDTSTGVWKTVEEACAACIRTTARVRPNKKLAELYQRYAETYDKLYRDLKERFREITALSSC